MTLLEKPTLGIRLERTDTNSGNCVLFVTQLGSSREVNMPDVVNKTLRKIMLNICINEENYMEKLISVKEI